MDKNKIFEDETDLDLALEQIQSDYQRLQNEVPPDLVDQAVLNMARREAEGQRTTRRRRMQWVGALSSLALLVVTLNLVVDHQGPVPQSMDIDKGARMKQENDAASGVALERRQSIPEPESISERQAAPMLQSIGASDEAVLADQGEALPDEAFKTDPNAWLEHVLDLQERGLNEQAEAELQALREAYPEFPLPVSLQ